MRPNPNPPHTLSVSLSLHLLSSSVKSSLLHRHCWTNRCVHHQKLTPFSSSQFKLQRTSQRQTHLLSTTLKFSKFLPRHHFHSSSFTFSPSIPLHLSFSLSLWKCLSCNVWADKHWFIRPLYFFYFNFLLSRAT